MVTAADNTEQLNLDDVARIFLGKVTRYPSGEEVEPLNMDPSDPSFTKFARVVLNKTPSQLKAYWAKRIFTGKANPRAASQMSLNCGRWLPPKSAI